MRAHLAAALGTAVLTAGVLSGAPAAEAQTSAAYAFHVPNGNTWTDGTVTFYNRSVLVEGVHKSVDATSMETCRATYAYTLDINSHELGRNGSDTADTACGNSRSFSFTVPADVAGGAAFVRICLDDGYYKDLTCLRYGG
ncbi:hypothetical protein GCM10018793_58240 [Streptomyces sulfonofaciens]|uniref:Secreted protein n=1 Tax=Streptomyces sulfonofaciens TaxID=68272 RepID=A0A919GKC2_9ACTN|nr:hypothetical protein [Streptomyces sulfonofaciens]GHH86420.1 hypothetical protein GCM10018793_58240 [Streptomyces sulfonofaciens]